MKHRYIKSRGDKRKCIFNMLGSIFSGALGYTGQQETNMSNRQMNREQIKANMEMQDRSNQFSEYMWNKSNEYNAEYNSPQAQRDRLIKAGINPLSANIGNQPAQAASPQGATGSVGSMTPMVNPYSGFPNLGSALRDDMIKEQQAKLLKEEAREKELKNNKVDYENAALTEPFMFFIDDDGKKWNVPDSYGHKTIGEALAYKKLRFDYDSLQPTLEKVRSESKIMSYNEKMSSLDANNKQNAINLDNALKEVEISLKESDVKLNNQKFNESVANVRKLEKDIEYIGKLMILADDEHSINQVNKRLAELQEKIQSESKKLLSEGWSLDAVGALFKALLVNLVNNIGVSVGGSAGLSKVIK